jgi:hypothetical protein
MSIKGALRKMCLPRATFSNLPPRRRENQPELIAMKRREQIRERP